MSLTTQQLQTLKTYIASVPALNTAPMNADGDQVIADALNAISAPDFFVWRTDVARDDVTGEGFDWTQVDNLTNGQARIWDLIFQTRSGTLSFADPGKRAGISECWKGTAAKVAVATFIFSKANRRAKVAERLLATGTGTAATPATMTFEGNINRDQVEAARLLP